MVLMLTILVLLSFCNYLTASIGTNVLTTAETLTSHMCKRLCLYTTRCASYRWDVFERRCHLNSELSDDTLYTTIQKTSHICGNRPCADHAVCVPVEAASGYICLLMQNSRSTTVTTVNTTAAAAASVTYTSTVTPTTIVSTTGITTTQNTTKTNISTTDSVVVATTSVTVVTTTTIAPTTTMAAVTITTTVAATTTTVTYNYTGCYQDDWFRVFPYHKMTSISQTTDKCFKHCRENNRAYFGTENSNQCFCGDVIKSGYQKRAEPECKSNCSGDVATKCGGPWRISIYRID